MSEPDVFSQLVQLLDFSGSNDAEVSALTRACLLLTCKDWVDGQQPVWVLKFRSFVVEIADLIYAHFPQAKSLFLYRNADAWWKSSALAFSENVETQERLIGFWMRTKMWFRKLDHYNLVSMEEIGRGLLISLIWLSCMERCLERLEAGQPMLPVRYEDLKVNPELVIGGFLITAEFM